MCPVYTIGEMLARSGRYHNFVEHLLSIGVLPGPDFE